MKEGCDDVAGYLIEFGPRDPGYLTPEEYFSIPEARTKPAWALHRIPQQGCSQEPVVYRGLGWVEPENWDKDSPEVGHFEPLYVGRKVFEPSP